MLLMHKLWPQIEMIDNKKKILNYLKSFRSDCLAAGKVYDSIKDEYTDIVDEAFDDGEFYWSSVEIYYFENYNIKLDADFIKKVV